MTYALGTAPAPDTAPTPARAQPPPLRLSPPWTPGNYIEAQAPSLRVAFVHGWYVIHSAGGHIVCSTACPETLRQLLTLERDQGYGAVEMLAQGHPSPCGCHGLVRPMVAPAPQRKAFSLEDLGL